MRRFRSLVGLSALLAASAQSQIESPSPSGWTETATSASAVKAGIALPLSAGTVRKADLSQYDNDGADLAARYLSVDQAIQGTIYLSQPTFADTGLAFLATDEAIRLQWGKGTHVSADQLGPVAGVKNAERRVTYEGAKSGERPLVTIASFVRAGSWLVIAQITGSRFSSACDEFGFA